MIDFTIQTQIARSPEQVFGYVSDPSKLSSWQTNTISLTLESEGPLGLGSRLREVHNAPGGKQLESLVEVCEYQPNRVFALRTPEGTMPTDAHITFRQTDTSTCMRFRVHGQPTGPMRLCTAVARTHAQRPVHQHCKRLRELLEQASAEDGPTSAGRP